MTEGDDIPDVREPSPLDKLRAWLGPPRRYTLTRWLILRLLGLVYVFAFIGLVRQGPALWGSHGLTPTAPYLDALAQSGTGFWDLPSVLCGAPPMARWTRGRTSASRCRSRCSPATRTASRSCCCG